uniref:Uncharacterized protein n=1 Tax=Micrurus lemniscatus lemniscatus TaxID=129467 RepID=A0A2D4IHM6_MICLE
MRQPAPDFLPHPPHAEGDTTAPPLGYRLPKNPGEHSCIPSHHASSEGHQQAGEEVQRRSSHHGKDRTDVQSAEPAGFWQSQELPTDLNLPLAVEKGRNLSPSNRRRRDLSEGIRAGNLLPLCLQRRSDHHQEKKRGELRRPHLLHVGTPHGREDRNPGQSDQPRSQRPPLPTHFAKGQRRQAGGSRPGCRIAKRQGPMDQRVDAPRRKRNQHSRERSTATGRDHQSLSG